MSNHFLRTLAKVGLVELDERETKKLASEPEEKVDMAAIDALLAAEDAAAASSKRFDARASASVTSSTTSAVRPAVQAHHTTHASEIVEGQPFAEIYAAARVAPSLFEAEKLLRILDGLQAMEPATRKAAVLAMDAADDEWTLADVVLDAQRKRKALDAQRDALDTQLTHLQNQAAADNMARDAYLEEATTSIRTKMAELEALLQKEVAQVTEQKSNIETGLTNANAAHQRETQRLSEEHARLAHISTLFAEKSHS